MTNRDMKSSKSLWDLERKRLVRDKFALLAMVGRRKREALASQEEAEFYYSIVTELLALSGDVLEFLQRAETKAPSLKGYVAENTSRYHDLIQRLLQFWPTSSASKERALNLLDSDGLERVLASTPDGYVSLSTDLILANVERAIEAIRVQSLKL
jgi:hypothetical protein